MFRVLLGCALGAAAAVAVVATPAVSGPQKQQQLAALVASAVPVAPDVPQLGSRLSGGVREFAVTAMVFKQHLATFPVRTAEVWGYRDDIGRAGPTTPGPTAVVYEGERVRFTVRNELPEPTTVHFHGLHQPKTRTAWRGSVSRRRSRREEHSRTRSHPGTPATSPTTRTRAMRSRS